MEESVFNDRSRMMVNVARRGAWVRHKDFVNCDMMAVVIIVNNRQLSERVFNEINKDGQAFLSGALHRIDSVPEGLSRSAPDIDSDLEDVIMAAASYDVDGNPVANSVTPEGILREILSRHYSYDQEGTEESQDDHPQGDSQEQGGRPGSGMLSTYCDDWTARASGGAFHPAYGREKEMQSVLRTLLRKNKCNPILTGDPGVGKTAIVEWLAIKSAQGDMPEKLRGKKIMALNVSKLAEEHGAAGFKALFADAAEAGDIILFIDEIHTLIDERRSMNIANVLKPELTGGRLKLIGATTAEEYSRFIESNNAFERRLKRIEIDELPPSATLSVLHSLRHSYEEHHGVTIDDEALKVAVDLSGRYVGDKKQPDKSLDLLDDACSKVSLSSKGSVNEDDIREILSIQTGIPVQRLSEDEMERLRSLEVRLKEDVRGQDEAVSFVARAIKQNGTGLSDPRMPIGSFLFLGPTGVGKTALAKSLAKNVQGDEGSLTRIDMSEYSEEFSVTRLIGSPPGYVGYESGGQLTEAIHRKPYSTILFDEIEKAHPKVIQLLLQVLDDGRLTDGRGRTIDFRNTIIIFTGNVGSKEVNSVRNRIGFNATQTCETRGIITEKAVKGCFPPEFIGRLSAIVLFNKLDRDVLKSIAVKMLTDLGQTFLNKGYEVAFDESVAEYVLSSDKTDEYGARPVRDAVRNDVGGILTEMILSGDIVKGSPVTITAINGVIEIR